MNDVNKQAYLSPANGMLDITVIRDARPYALISLDLGIPNFTVFSLKFPLVEDKPNSMSELVAEAVHTLLDEMSAFMISCGFAEEIIVKMYATVLTCFKGMTGEADTNKSMSPVSKDPTVKVFEGTFKLPMEFINETYEKVVTASSGKTLKRPPVHRRLELTYDKPMKTTVNDARVVIRNFRNRSLKSQPNPMYIIVYDVMGNPKGTIPLGTAAFKNNLLNAIYKNKRASAAPEFSPTVKFDNDVEMKTTNAEGIPKSIFVGDEQYEPHAFISDDMALYINEKREFVVKFPDGRCVAFADFPTVEELKEGNYPVPTIYTNWTMLAEGAVPESSDLSEAVDEQGNEVIEPSETDVNPQTDLTPDDEKNEQLEEGEDNKTASAKSKSRLEKLKLRRPDLVESGFFEKPLSELIGGIVRKKKADGFDEKGYWVGAGGGASGILPICTTTGRIALAWRSPHVASGDCWGTIGGAIQPKMSPGDSAKKELAEETGYRGDMRLIPAFVFTDGSFKYHNFLGLVPTEFSLNPMAGGGHGLEFSDETDALEWFTWDELQELLEQSHGDFHPGLVTLLQNSGDQIQKIVQAASNKP
jgi:8-oxo-dGTP pyrophosphatase MutT (NUDIX family)